MLLYGDGKTDDTISIQAMLDKRGVVKIDKEGDYLITKTLIIHSNTRFELASGVRLIAGKNSHCALIQNEFFTGGGRDHDIELIGGIYDGNCDEQGINCYELIEYRNDYSYDANRFSGKLLRIAHCDKITLKNLTVRNPIGYGIQIGDTVDFEVSDIYFDYNWHYGCTDGVHINGPAKNGIIENLSGTTNDDMVSLTPGDEQHAEVTSGEISDVVIRNVTANNGYSGIRLLSCSNFALRNIVVSGVYGTYRHNAVLISHHFTTPDTRNLFDNIVVEKVHSSKSETPLTSDCFTLWENGAENLSLVWLYNDINVTNLVLRDITRTVKQSTDAPLIMIEDEVNIEHLVLDKVAQKLIGDTVAPLICGGASVKNTEIIN